MGKAKSRGGGGPGKKKKNKNYRPPGGKRQGVELRKPEVPQNPFEIQINKRKHETLGRIAKHEMGHPGVSRSRAIQKRKSTLLEEYKVRGKTNVLMDKRLGEKSKSMSEEDKIARRSALEKSRMFKKKSIFNLNDDDDFLTHKGQTLTQVDRYDDPRDLSDSDEERLDEQFVSEANFGGFLRMKKGGDSQDVDEDGVPKTRDQIIAEMILESKKRKADKAKELDENYEKVQELDDEFKSPEFRQLLNAMNAPSKAQDIESILRKHEEKEPSVEKKTDTPLATVQCVKPQITDTSTTSQQDPYDRLIRELQFEKKTGSASNRTKTDQETAQETEANTTALVETKRKRNHNRMVLIMRAFSDIVISDARSVHEGFELCDVTYEILKQWKKYCPEVIIFLTSLMRMFDEVEFKTTVQPGLTSARNVFQAHPCWIFEILNRISKFIVLYKYLPSSYELFKPTLQLVTKWKSQLEENPSTQSQQVTKFKLAIDQVIDSITSAKEKKEPVVMEREKPVALKLYEPAIDEEFDGVRKRKSSNKTKQTQERLQHKVKREMKSAMREIKKDNAFISRVVRKEEHAKDEERKRKVKELLGDLANQEGDYKKSKRGKT